MTSLDGDSLSTEYHSNDVTVTFTKSNIRMLINMVNVKYDLPTISTDHMYHITLTIDKYPQVI